MLYIASLCKSHPASNRRPQLLPREQDMAGLWEFPGGKVRQIDSVLAGGKGRGWSAPRRVGKLPASSHPVPTLRAARQVEEGETPEAALVRELREELCIEVRCWEACGWHGHARPGEPWGACVLCCTSGAHPCCRRRACAHRGPPGL